jgi:hypothetical protein
MNGKWVLQAMVAGLAGTALWAQIPSNPDPRWWRGNLHAHTLWSDGDDFPEMAVE